MHIVYIVCFTYVLHRVVNVVFTLYAFHVFLCRVLDVVLRRSEIFFRYQTSIRFITFRWEASVPVIPRRVVRHLCHPVLVIHYLGRRIVNIIIIILSWWAISDYCIVSICPRQICCPGLCSVLTLGFKRFLWTWIHPVGILDINYYYTYSLPKSCVIICSFTKNKPPTHRCSLTSAGW